MFIFDIEIRNAIADFKTRKVGFRYCDGWNDYAGMGIACIGVWDYQTNASRVFGEDNLEEFKKFIETQDIAIGFNNDRFDNNVLRANGIVIQPDKSYDLLSAIYSALGSRQKGCRLEDVIKANFSNAAGKTGDGSQAPMLWQSGCYTSVIDYCLNDVRLTKMLIDKIIRFGYINNPIYPSELLRLKRP